MSLPPRTFDYMAADGLSARVVAARCLCQHVHADVGTRTPHWRTYHPSIRQRPKLVQIQCRGPNLLLRAVHCVRKVRKLLIKWRAAEGRISRKPSLRLRCKCRKRNYLAMSSWCYFFVNMAFLPCLTRSSRVAVPRKFQARHPSAST